MPKTAAERSRDYRRKKRENKIKKIAKSSTERVREFRARQKMLLQKQNNICNVNSNVSDVLNTQTQAKLDPQDVECAASGTMYLEVSPLIVKETEVTKTIAQRQKENRARKKIEKELNCPKRIPKTNAETQQKCRRIQKETQQRIGLSSNLDSTEQKNKKNSNQVQKGYQQRVKNETNELLKKEILAFKDFRSGFECPQFDILQKNENVSHLEGDKVKPYGTKEEITEDFSMIEGNAEDHSTDVNIETELITIKCEVFEEEFIPEGGEVKPCTIKEEFTEDFNTIDGNAEDHNTDVTVDIKREVCEEEFIPSSSSHDFILHKTQIQVKLEPQDFEVTTNTF